MKIIGLDFGLKKIGLATSEGIFAQADSVIKIKNPQDAAKIIAEICCRQNAEKIIIGLSEGKMGQITKKFGTELKKISGLPVEFYDETLTTQDAQKLLIAGGRSAQKRRLKEDAASAALILQSWLDEKENKF